LRSEPSMMARPSFVDTRHHHLFRALFSKTTSKTVNLYGIPIVAASYGLWCRCLDQLRRKRPCLRVDARPRNWPRSSFRSSRRAPENSSSGDPQNDPSWPDSLRPRRPAVEKCCHWDPRYGRLRATLGATPWGYTGNPVVQKGLILRGFLEAALKWRRGRDSHPRFKTSRQLKTHLRTRTRQSSVHPTNPGQDLYERCTDCDRRAIASLSKRWENALFKASWCVGAGEGNRTLVCSLGSCRSTIELRPQNQ
jgi:hypothetical protein